ncbi:heparinase II/III family protein [uncultured Cohaesibacter sp.]|uniref:heparinase II/III family protein n=1 Tax=uncultured Cohaesibacter sp. TaxID=1002546 RepID=UPI0029C6417C|nr:heparinase II/III family protein [uncultured Cohaesibacter sp.]
MSEKWQNIRLHMAALSRRAKGVRIRRPNCQKRYVPGCPERLLIAPQDLRTADPTIAEDIYAGHFVFAGQVENCEGQSPFRILSPSKEWAQELNGFRWLRHLRASEATLSRSNAQILVEDWIHRSPRLGQEAWELPVVANRVMAWLSNSPLILQQADHNFYRAFVRALYLQVRYLRASQALMPNNVDRLYMLIAELAGWLCLSGKERYIRSTSKRLVHELDAQILPDGGHVSRNPVVILSLLLDLLPLRQTFLSRDMVPPEGMNRAIERMMPMLRFFRHHNGAFAHFNGTGATPADQLATIMAYDDTRGTPVSNASFSGYQRMEAGSTLLLMDTGDCPPVEQSVQAHAGTLSFELSVGAAFFVVNCGSPSCRHASWRELSRSTAAHSTLSIQDRSTCTIAKKSLDLGGRPLLCSGLKAEVNRSMDQAQETIITAHEGYAAAYGIRHERQLWMAIDGRSLDGHDELKSVGKGIRKGQDSYAIRFHMHPSVQVETSDDRDMVYLGLSNGEIWSFSAQEMEVTIEDSVFLSDIHGIQPTKQLVLYGYASHIPSVHWKLKRVAFAD